MGRRMRGFEAAALVNGHVHNHGAWLHGLQHLSIDQFWSACAGDKDSTYHHVCCEYFILDRLNA